MFDPPYWSPHVSTVWSPDGKHIAATIAGNIVSVDIDSGRTTVLGAGDQAAWSRDGNWIAYSGDNYSKVYIVPADGHGAPMSIAAGAGPNWGP
jgi:Tol biopolymer transport system component